MMGHLFLTHPIAKLPLPEDADRRSAPNTIHGIHRYCTDWIIDVDLVEEDGPQDHDNAADDDKKSVNPEQSIDRIRVLSKQK